MQAGLAAAGHELTSLRAQLTSGATQVGMCVPKVAFQHSASILPIYGSWKCVLLPKVKGGCVDAAKHLEVVEEKQRLEVELAASMASADSELVSANETQALRVRVQQGMCNKSNALIFSQRLWRS